MSNKSHINFDLLINKRNGHYEARVISSPAGQASNNFSFPFSENEIENILLGIANQQSNIKRSLDHDNPENNLSVIEFGEVLYETLFVNTVGELFRVSQAISLQNDQKLRICLNLSNAPDLINIPWELLFNPSNNHYIGLSVNTSIVRNLDILISPKNTPVEEAILVLVMISSPEDYSLLDTEKEWDKINQATQSLQDQGKLILKRIEPSLSALQRSLRKNRVNIFHFIGHGGYDEKTKEGVLIFQDKNNKSKSVDGQHLGTILHDAKALQLVILNSCRGGKTSSINHFSGVGQRVLQKGVSAVIAMQFNITDKAAIIFAHEFYAALVDGYPIDASVTEARKMIYSQVSEIEWATPVLYVNTNSSLQLHTQIPVKQSATSDGKLNVLEANKKDGFEYDVYISYFENDVSFHWLDSFFIPILEENNIKYVTSTDQGNTVLGDYQVVSTDIAIEKSRRTILIISDDYLQNNIATFESALAQQMGLEEGAHRVIPVYYKEPFKRSLLPTRFSFLKGVDLNHKYRAEKELKLLISTLKLPLS